MNKRKISILQQPSWLVTSKISPPQSSVQVVDRPALTKKLDGALDVRLSLVLASAGYGKTTLLALWREKLMANGVAVSWLALDEEDRQSKKFIPYLIWALSRANIIIDGLLDTVANEVTSIPSRSLISTLLNGLSTTKKQLVIILDDYHRGQSNENDDLLAFFLRHLSGNVHVVISSREVPKFGWAEFSSRGEMLELGVTDLQFAFPDAKKFISKNQNIDLSDPEIRELVQKTEGWALGLQLAIIYLKKQSQYSDKLYLFSGRTMEVTDYLLMQVFQQQPADIQNFLVQTSVLERFNGDLANAVCCREDSWRVMEQLYQRNLFIFFLDQEREWCRYHDLFSEFLKERLRRRGRAESEAVHDKAARWFSSHGMISDAVKHALQSGSLELVAQIAEEAGGWRLAIKENLLVLRKVCSRLPENMLRKYPRLWLGDILMSAKSGRIDDAQRKLRELDWRQAGLATVSELVKAERLAIGILIAGYEDRPVTAQDLDEINQLAQKPKFEDDLVLMLLRNYLCLLYLDAGRFNQSIEEARKCKNYFAARGDEYGASIIDTHIGQSELAQAHLNAAAKIYSDIYDKARHYLGDGGDATAISRVLLAETDYYQNDLESASQHLQASLPHIEIFDGWFDIYASGYATAASLSHISQGIDAAMAMLDRADEIARRRNLDRLGRLVRLLRVRELTKAVDLRAAEAFAAEFEPFEEAEMPIGSQLPSWRLLEAAGTCLADLSLQLGDKERALAILRPRLAQAEANGWALSSMKMQIKLAMCHDAIGNHKEARELIGKSLLKAAPQNFIRQYLDEGAALKKLLNGLRRRDELLIPAVKDFVAVILGERAEGKELLTDREKEVLDLIIKGCSSKETAFRLGLSMNTIKYHRKRLFEKLGAASRAQAISAARKLALYS